MCLKLKGQKSPAGIGQGQDRAPSGLGQSTSMGLEIGRNCPFPLFFCCENIWGLQFSRIVKINESSHIFAVFERESVCASSVRVSKETLQTAQRLCKCECLYFPQMNGRTDIFDIDFDSIYITINKQPFPCDILISCNFLE